MQCRVKPSAVGSVITLQLAVRVWIFVFVGVLKVADEHPDTICLGRWCVSGFTVGLCACSCLLCACLQVYVTFHLPYDRGQITFRGKTPTAGLLFFFFLFGGLMGRKVPVPMTSVWRAPSAEWLLTFPLLHCSDQFERGSCRMFVQFFFFRLPTSSFTQNIHKHQCLGWIWGFWMSWSLLSDLFWRESKSHGCISL